MNRRSIAFALFCLAILPAVGCDKATPVAPTGTTLTLSANPSKIGLNGTSTITIVGRKPDGNPLNPGTEIRLTTDRGTITPVVEIGDGGVATATLRADGRAGTAMISASTGDAMVETSVQIGEAEEDRPTVLVSVTPSEVPLQGTAEITVVARNSDGSPVEAGRPVILTTTLGSITTPNPQTGANGIARATLRAGDREGTATVTAVVGSSEPATTEVTIFRDAATAIDIVANPSTVRSDQTTQVTISATVFNLQGARLPGVTVTFQTDVGEFQGGNTAETTNSNGQATKTLVVRPQDVLGIIESFEVSARTPSSTGTLLEGSTTIRIIRPQ
jgi:hypothetical protein